MNIVVLAKHGCGKCESFQGHLRAMNVAFESVDIDDPVSWREGGAVNALAAAVHAGMDFRRPPVIVIDGEAYAYAAAMRKIKSRRRAAAELAPWPEAEDRDGR